MFSKMILSESLTERNLTNFLQIYLGAKWTVPSVIPLTQACFQVVVIILSEPSLGVAVLQSSPIKCKNILLKSEQFQSKITHSKLQSYTLSHKYSTCFTPTAEIMAIQISNFCISCTQDNIWFLSNSLST